MSPALVDAPVVKRNDVTVRLDAEVAAKAKTVAASRNQNLAEYLSEVLAPIVERDLKGEAAKWMRDTPPPAAKRKPKGGDQ
jgi:hypothetical protein